MYLVKKLNQLASLALWAGLLMQLFGHGPEGRLVFAIGFGGYLVLKLGKALSRPGSEWRPMHRWQIALLAIAVLVIVLRYLEYPYLGWVLGLVLLVEGLLSLRIGLTDWLGRRLRS